MFIGAWLCDLHLSCVLRHSRGECHLRELGPGVLKFPFASVGGSRLLEIFGLPTLFLPLLKESGGSDKYEKTRRIEGAMDDPTDSNEIEASKKNLSKPIAPIWRALKCSTK